MVNNKILISAGDLSGEIHATNLIREIKKQSPYSYIYSLGGNHLKEVSDNFIEDIVNINAFGFLPIKQFFFLKKILKKLEELFVYERPDKIILVDYYGFHIFLAKLAKKFAIPVYYYVSPQVWASRQARIKELRKYIKKMFVILPFEEKIYKQNGVDAVFVVNPLIDNYNQKEDTSLHQPVLIGLFPGSRQSVIKRHMPIILKTAKILNFKIGAKFILFSTKSEIGFDLPNYIELETQNDISKRKSVDIALCPSGTVSMENALMAIPMIVMYKLSTFNYLLIRMIIKVKFITLVNILARRAVIPEFIQFNAKPEKLANAILEQLKPDLYAKKVEELKEFRQMLGNPGVSKRVAQLILDD